MVEEKFHPKKYKRNQKQPNKSCLYCGVDISSTHKSRKFCSDLCKLKNFRQRERDNVICIMHNTNKDDIIDMHEKILIDQYESIEKILKGF